MKSDVELFNLLEYPNGTTETITLSLHNGFKPGYTITAVGQTIAVFAFNIYDSAGNIILHFVPRFETVNAVILNSFFGQWGAEERTDIMPIRKNEKFSLTCAYEEYGYRIFIDGVQIAFYKHRSTNTPEKCTIGGGLQIYKVNYARGQPLWAVKNTSIDFGPHGIPYYTTSLPQFLPGTWIVFTGHVNEDSMYITIDLLNEDDIMLHFNVRFNENRVIRNSFFNGQWGIEEISNGLPLNKGKSFSVAFIMETPYFRIYVNGEEYATYKHRAIFASKTTIRISGGIKLLKFAYVQ